MQRQSLQGGAGSNCSMDFSLAGLVFPRQVFKWIVWDPLDVFQQPGQIVEGIDAGQLTGMDQAHKQIAHVGPAAGAVKQRVFAMDDGVF